MIIILSPSKTMDFSKNEKEHTQPDFLNKSSDLIKELRKLSKDEISSLMKLSHKLTELNYERYRDFSTPFTTDNAKQAIFAFKGDVYEGLDVEKFSDDDIKYAQNHLRMLSGLYGLLKPLDLIQPYRLEMGTKLKNKNGKNLYEFWDNLITDKLNELLDGDILLNLASNEYYKAVKAKNINGKIISPAFKEYKNGEFKMIALFAKKARGMMARYVIKNKITNIESLKNFDYEGYSYNEELSSDAQPVFVR